MSSTAVSAVTKRKLGPLAFVEVGEGPPIMFLHGIGSSSASFTQQIESLSARFRVIAPDALGYADSEDPEVAPGMDGFAQSVCALIDELAVGPVAVVGLSWGGVIATRVALLRPDTVSALVLADSSVGSGADPSRRQAMLDRPAELVAVGAIEFANRRHRRLLSPQASADLRARVVANMAESIRMPGYGYAAEAMAATDHRSRLAEITVPTLVLVGEHDVVCPAADSQLLVEGIAGASFATLSGAGHLSNQECPEQFNDLVSSFLSGHPTPTLTHLNSSQLIATTTSQENLCPT